MKATFKTGLMSTAAAVLAMAGTADAQGRVELILSGFGGAYDEALERGLASFEEEYNVDVTIVASAGAENLARVRNREIDVMISDPVFALRAELENVFVPLDPELVPNLANLFPQAHFSEYTVAQNFGAYVLAYNPDNIDPPTSWYDLADPQYQGRVAIRTFRPENIELITLFARQAGGSEENLDPGFEQMALVADNVHTFVNTHAEMLGLYQNDEVDIGIWTDGRINWANQEGATVAGVIPQEGFFPIIGTLNVVEGRPNVELSQRLVNHLLGEEVGLEIVTALGYYPSNATVVVPPEVQENLFIGPETIDDMITTDWHAIVAQYDALAQRWDREIVR